MSADEGGLGARVRAALDGYVSGVSLLDEITDRVMDSVADEFWRLTDERDRLTRERDEAREALAHPRFIVAGIDQDPEVMAKVMREWRPMLTVPETADEEIKAEALEDAADDLDREPLTIGGSYRAAEDAGYYAEWLRERADALRAALGDGRASGRDQAARPSSTPPRPSEHTPRPADWTHDSPAVQPNEHDDEESDHG